MQVIQSIKWLQEKKGLKLPRLGEEPPPLKKAA
jgi:hypothetical protein